MTFSYKLKITLAIFIPIALIISIIIGIFYIKETNFISNRYRVNAENMTSLQIEKLRNDFRHVVKDLTFLTYYHQTQLVIKDNEYNEIEYKELCNDFLLFSVGSKLYDQIRILNTDGMEIIRVNFNSGTHAIVPKDQLQFKGDRYYFNDTIGLKRGEIFLSPFDLNIEQNKIEIPLKPMIRFGTPIYNALGEKRGVFILNFLGENLIKHFTDTVEHSPGHYMLLNSDSYWIVGRDKEEEWGFMYEDKKNSTMGASFPEAWKTIGETESGQFSNADGLFTFKTIYPIYESMGNSAISNDDLQRFNDNIDEKEYFWKVVSYIPVATIMEDLNTSRNKYIIIDFIILLPIGLLTVLLANDIAKRKQAQKKILKQNMDLLELNELKNKFLGMAAHDLRNPLTSIGGFSEIILNDELGPVPDEQREFLQIINKTSEEMLTLVNDLLDVSVIESGKLDLHCINDSINSLIEERIKINQVIADKQHISLHSDLGEIPSFMFDQKKISQVLDNLISNAIKFSPHDLNIYLITKIVNNRVKVSVRDEGPGISKEDQPKLFGTFQRLTAQPTDGEKSTGLGLSIVKKIVEAHGGTVSVESVLGEGATFMFELPLEQSNAK
ncbi:ATP-binding protein [Candidatus Latescibacterota bacterium]